MTRSRLHACGNVDNFGALRRRWEEAAHNEFV
jgi:hypothetical protein